MIEVRHDSQRGCGWRKPGGLYLVAGGAASPCGRLPAPLSRCPTCDCGIKPTRGWTWVDGDALLAASPCGGRSCGSCPLAVGIGRAGLLWIGEQFYGSPGEWTDEALALGVSRRIPAVPNGFVAGATPVLVAHRKVFRDDRTGTWSAGVFHLFVPRAIEYVVRGDETDEDIAAFRARGITPVRVERVGAGLFAEA